MKRYLSSTLVVFGVGWMTILNCEPSLIGAKASSSDTKGKLAELEKQLKSNDKDARRIAGCLILWDYDPYHKDAIAAALEATDHPDLDVRSNAASFWRNLLPKNPEALKILEKLLEHQDHNVALGAASALRDLGPAAKPAIPALTKALVGKDYNVAVTAAHALGKMGKEGKEAIPGLEIGMKKGLGWVRTNSAVSLLQIQEEHGAALKYLDGNLQSWNVETRIEAASGFHVIHPLPEKSLPILARSLTKDSSETVRMLIAMALPNYRAEPKAVVPLLEGACKDSSERVRGAAVVSLGKLGGIAAQSLPTIKNLLSDRHAIVRIAAANALGSLGQAAAPAIPNLEALLKETDVYVQEAAAKALKKIKGKDESKK